LKEGAKDFGVFLLLEAIFSAVYFIGKDDIFRVIQNFIQSSPDRYQFLSGLLSPDILAWVVGLVLIPLSSAIPYHFRLVREVNKYKGEGFVQEVTKQLSEFRGELNSIRKIMDDIVFEQNNMRQRLELLRKAYPQLDDALKRIEREEEVAD